jgi:hypothetical protein
MAAGEAQQVFETQRLSAAAWEERGVSLVGDPDLVVKIGGSLYSWQVRGMAVCIGVVGHFVVGLLVGMSLMSGREEQWHLALLAGERSGGWQLGVGTVCVH